MAKHVKNKDRYSFDGETWRRTDWSGEGEYYDVLLTKGENVLRGSVRITIDRRYVITISGGLDVTIPLPGMWQMYKKGAK